ncbi:MAG: hypothetical protein RSE13_05545 [Planktothrix sp. GU0601_MAG3]|nr:MAG: hypothetical protein RSE13_05545 [Planktothrix sp. GU0601_MAG3]
MNKQNIFFENSISEHICQRKLFCWKEETVSAGEITWTDRYEYHQLVNNSAEDCVTLHVYAPVRD